MIATPKRGQKVWYVPIIDAVREVIVTGEPDRYGFVWVRQGHDDHEVLTRRINATAAEAADAIEALAQDLLTTAAELRARKDTP